MITILQVLLVLRYFFSGQSLIMLYCYIKAFAFLPLPSC